MFSFIAGIIGIAAGIWMVLKTEALLENFGRIEFFEDKFGPGGSRLGYKLIGIGVVFFSTLAMTGLLSGFMIWALSPITSLGK